MQLLLLLSLFFFSLALGSLQDVLYIKKLSADEARTIDNKELSEFNNIFTKDVTYIAPSPNVVGVDKLEAAFTSALAPGFITQNSISTESITLLPPFDEQGAAGTATGVVYISLTVIGRGNLEGQSLTSIAKYEDKYVKTGDLARYGGWRISKRIFTRFGEAVGNLAVVSS